MVSVYIGANCTAQAITHIALNDVTGRSSALKCMNVSSELIQGREGGRRGAYVG